MKSRSLHIDPGIKVLCYHKFRSKKNFERQLNCYTKSNFLVTIDDGDYSVFDQAFYSLKNKGIKTVIFVITSLINTKIPFWWDEVLYYLGEKEGLKQLKWLKSIPNKDRLTFLEELRRDTKLPKLCYPQLTVAQLKEMQEAGVIIANHSHTHPMFDQCTEDEILQELQESRAFFDQHGLNGYHIFAYPNGNFSETAERILKEQGIEYAFLFDHKISFSPVNPMRISRLSVNDDTPLWKFKLIISGWHSRFLPFIKKLFSAQQWIKNRLK